MKTCRALLLSLCFLAKTVCANTFASDLTDLWWNANESGWGVTATHQGKIVFLTFFVYGADNKPVWYTGQAGYAGQSVQGAQIYSGEMYQTSGPWLGTAFDPGTVGVTRVGSVTFTALVSSATLAYSVDGTSVSKALTRQTFRSNGLTGEYIGAIRGINSGCLNPLDNGPAEDFAVFRIAHVESSFSMIASNGLQICNYTGNYTQAGRMGRSIGTYTCPATSGSYDLVEIEATPRTLTGRLTSSSAACSQFTGHVAFAKRL